MAERDHKQKGNRAMEPDVSIRSLLRRIKEEGIEEARNASERILSEAHSQAASILERAKEEARDIRERTDREIERDRASFEAAMAQAGRNLIIGTKRRIIELCDRILERELKAALSPEVMKQMILGMVEKWQPRVETDGGVEILVNPEDLQALEEMLLRSLKDDMKGGLSLKPVQNVRAGFQIGEKGGSMHYDLTHRALAEMLAGYLNPRVAGYLTEAAEEDEGPP